MALLPTIDVGGNSTFRGAVADPYAPIAHPSLNANRLVVPLKSIVTDVTDVPTVPLLERTR